MPSEVGLFLQLRRNKLAEIEKKYSNYQSNECDTQDSKAPVLEELCPPCQPDPNFKLGGNWFEIEDPYLHKEFCEYRVRVYNSEVTENESLLAANPEGEMRSKVIDRGIEKILLFYNKSNDAPTRDALSKATYLINPSHYDRFSGLLGVANLVAIPAFNFNQIAADGPIEDISSKGSSDSEQLEDEIILDGRTLRDDLFKLRSSINAFGFFYRAAQHVDQLVIKQENNPVLRIDYKHTVRVIRDFYNELNKVLKDNDFLSFDQGGFFSYKKNVRSLKLVFEPDGVYDLKSIYAMPDNGCEKYQKLSGISKLKYAQNKVLFNFLAQLDEIINDITAKKTKPWLDFTLEYFYPKYIVDYGGNTIGITDEQRSGLSCLLEEQLGLGNGQVIDSLTGIILSGFKVLEERLMDEACRQLENAIYTGDADSEARMEVLRRNSKTPEDERHEALQGKLVTKYKNKIYSKLVKIVKEKENNMAKGRFQKPVNRSNLFTKHIDKFSDPGLTFTLKITGVPIEEPLNIINETDITMYAKDFASMEYNSIRNKDASLFRGGRWRSSPHWQDIKLLKQEKFNDENSFLGALKEGDFAGKDLIPLIGLCGMSKLTGKALKCLLGGIEIDDFYDVVIQKTLEYLKINTLDVLLAELPADFRKKLDEAIDKEFFQGDTTELFLSDTPSLETLPSTDKRAEKELKRKYKKELKEENLQKVIDVTKTQNGNRSMKDMVDFNSTKRLMKIIEFIQDEHHRNFPDGEVFHSVTVVKGLNKSFFTPALSDDEIEFLENSIIDTELKSIMLAYKQLRIPKEGYGDPNSTDKKINMYSFAILREQDGVRLSDEAKLKRHKRVAYKLVKAHMKKRKKQDSSVRKAMARLKEMLDNIGDKKRAKKNIEDILENSNLDYDPTTADETYVKIGEAEERLETIDDVLVFIEDWEKTNNTTEVFDDQFKPRYPIGRPWWDFTNNRTSDDFKEIYDAFPGLLETAKYYADLANQLQGSSSSHLDTPTVDINYFENLRNDFEKTKTQTEGEIEALREIASNQNTIDTIESEKEEAKDAKDKAKEEQAAIKKKNKEAKAAAKEKEKDEKAATKAANKAAKEAAEAKAAKEAKKDPEELNDYEKAAKSIEETALGVKLDIVFDLIYDYTLESIMSYFAADELLQYLQNVPAIDLVLDSIEDLSKKCDFSHVSVIDPPIEDFMKSLSLDLCNPIVLPQIPKITIPTVDWASIAMDQFAEIFEEAIIKLISDIIMEILNRILSSLEGALCNLLEGVGGFAIDAIKNTLPNKDPYANTNLWDGFVQALNEAFCNDSEDQISSRAKAEQLAEELFNPILGIGDPSKLQGSGAKVSNIISSVASRNEFLEAMVAEDGSEQNAHFNLRIANAISTLAPEFSVLLGSPDLVAYFFRNLGSYLSVDERERIRDLLAAGIPNLPISKSICLTSDQLDAWDDLRRTLLSDLGLSPEDARNRVNELNNKTNEALEQLMDDSAALQDEDGPFMGALDSELNKNPCNPDNVLASNFKPEFMRSIENDQIDAHYNTLKNHLKLSMITFAGGLFNEALRDTRDNGLVARGFFKLFNPIYMNDQEELNVKYDEKETRISKAFLDLFDTSDDENGDGYPDVIGEFPDTVGIKLRKELVDDYDTNVSISPGGDYAVTESVFEKKRVVFFDTIEYKDDLFNTARNVCYKYEEGEEQDRYKSEICITDKNYHRDSLKYNTQIIATFGKSKKEELPDYSYDVAVSLTKEEQEYLAQNNFVLEANSEADPRKDMFKKVINNNVPISRDFVDLYHPLFEVANKKLVQSILSNPTMPESIPMGFQYGYEPEDLRTSDWEYLNPDGSPYDKDESEQILGKYGNPRIVVLDPQVYGGRYSNPPYYMAPRSYYGWIELAETAFGGDEGCDPKTPPVFDFEDIKNHVKDRKDTIPTDYRLGKPAECVTVKPFHALHIPEVAARIEGTIMTTIRVFLGEYYYRGAGTFLNLEIKDENYDSGLATYIAESMKKEMIDLGMAYGTKHVRIVKEKYWYTFLEQVVTMYQRKIDLDNYQAPEHILETLNTIQTALDKYEYPTPGVKKRMIRDKKIKLPGRLLTKNDVDDIYFHQWGISYRVYGDKIFTSDSEVKYDSMRFYALKKIRFFSKILFIRIFEKECITILAELIKEELTKISKKANDTLLNKPYIYDLYKSFLGMPDFFPNSTSKVGLWSYYVDKQAGKANPGNIPEVSKSNETFSVQPTEEPQFVVESYLKIIDKEDQQDIPDFIKGRQDNLRSVVSLTEFSNFIDQNISVIGDEKISDFFGDLTFSYELPLKSIFDSGFSSSEDKGRLLELNPEKFADIQNAYTNYMTSTPFEDFMVTCDERFIVENADIVPNGVLGNLGMNYGIRVSVLLPKEFMSSSELEDIRSNFELLQLSRNEKAYIFEDNSFLLPIANAEVQAIDQSLASFNPVKEYDLECLINKLVDTSQFKVFFDKIMNFRQTSSAVATYCIHNFPPAIGADESERDDIDDPDQWDKTINSFIKNQIRKEFGSLYLSGTPDSGKDGGGDDDGLDKLRIINPLSQLKSPAIRIPWFRKQRLVKNAIDANGIECANPSKDLEE